MLDTGAWKEYLSGGPEAERLELMVADPAALVVPTVVLAEVQGWILDVFSSGDAMTVVASMRQGRVVALSERLAARAAEFAHRHGLGLIEAVAGATALETGATWVTLDPGLDGLPGVRLLGHGKKKKKKR